MLVFKMHYILFYAEKNIQIYVQFRIKNRAILTMYKQLLLIYNNSIIL